MKKALKLCFAVLMTASLVVDNVGARDVGSPTGLSLAGNDDGGRRKQTKSGLLRSNTNTKLSPAALSGSTKDGGATPGAIMEELKSRLDALSLLAGDLGEGNPEDTEVATLMEEVSNVQAALSMDPSIIAKATFEEKILMVKEMSNSFVVFGQLMPMLEKLAEATVLGTGSVSPLLEQLKTQLVVAETSTDEFVRFLAGLPFQEATAGAGAATEDKLPLDTERSDSLLTKKDASASPTKIKRRRYLADDSSFDQDNDTGNDNESAQEQKHWHGFESGREHRDWKNTYAHSHPRMNHLFQVSEHLHTGNFEALREKVIGMADTHANGHGKYHGGRRLQSSASKVEQCDLLVKCAKGMSLYDLIFYHFSDYIDASTGLFSSNFRLPPKFDLLQIEASIKTTAASIETTLSETEKLGQCDALLDHFHLEEPTKDSSFWAWKAGVVSEVCFSSGTTKKIDLFLIKKHIGREIAARVFRETVSATQLLHAVRDKTKYRGEARLYSNSKGGFRYPRSIKGFKVDPNTNRPILPIKLLDFYSMKDASLHLAFSQDQCPMSWYGVAFDKNDTGWEAIGHGPNTVAKCKTYSNQWISSQFASPRQACTESGGVYLGPDDNPTCFFPYEEDFIFNSTRSVFGDNSLGQVAALAEVHVETFSVASDKICPKNFHFVRAADNGVLCSRTETTACDKSCAQSKCHVYGGVWVSDPSRLIAEVKDGTIIRDPHMIAGQNQVPENGFQKYWDDGNDIDRMMNVIQDFMDLRDARDQLPGADVEFVEVGPPETDSVDTYAKAFKLCSEKRSRLVSLADICQFNASAPETELWIPVSDVHNSWVDLSARHTGCLTRKDLYLSWRPPRWEEESLKGIICAKELQIQTGELVPADDTVLYGPEETGSVNTYAKAKEFCTGKGHQLAASTDVCHDATLSFIQPHGDQWMPVSDMDNEWVQVGTAHKLCMSHNKEYGAPSWGLSEDKAPFEANFVLCKKKAEVALATPMPLPQYFIVVVGDHVAGVFSDLEAAKADLKYFSTNSGCRFESAPGTSTYTIAREPKLPGYCCLDAADASGTWGEPYHCEQSCLNYAPSFAGMSQSTCNIWGGKFCLEEQDCSPLKRCIARYLEDAQANGTSTFNPTYANYLRDAPNITDPSSADQCGKAREYFGFDKTFPIDMKICKKIGEYKNSGDMEFLNDVVKNMPDLPKPPPLPPPKEEPPEELDLKEIKIQSHQIKTSTKTKLGSASEPMGQCNADLQLAWNAILFSFEQILDTFQTILDAFVNLICPDDGWGITWSICCTVMNAINYVALVTVTVWKLILTIADFTQDTICGNLDPYSLEETAEEVKAIYKNTNTMYDTIAMRQAQTHTSLNSINLQLPKVGESLNAINAQHGEMDGKLNDILALRGATVDATLSSILLAVESAKTEILASIDSKCAADAGGGGGSRMLALLDTPSGHRGDHISESSYGDSEEQRANEADPTAKMMKVQKEELEGMMEEHESRIQSIIEDKIEGMMEQQAKMLQDLLLLSKKE